MQITAQQSARLRLLQGERFVARAVAFIGAEFPELAARSGPARVDHFVRFAMQRARHYGFASERSVMQFIVVMLKLGYRFDEDPQYANLRLPLAGMPECDPEVRMAFLLGMVADHLPAEENDGA